MEIGATSTKEVSTSAKYGQVDTFCKYSDSAALGWERMTWACDRVISPPIMLLSEATSSFVTGISFSGSEPKEGGILER